MTKLLQNCILTYFDLPGRGESIRLALKMGGIVFEDRRIPFTEWGALKPTTPWGSMPVLTLADGTTQIAQQRAVLRLVGAETGLYPSGTSSSLTCAHIDELMDALEDLPGTISSIDKAAPTTEDKLAARLAASQAGGAIYGILNRVDKFIATHGQKTTSSNTGSDSNNDNNTTTCTSDQQHDEEVAVVQHAVGDQWTIADLFVYTSCSGLGNFDGLPANILEPFQHIQACRKSVRNHPAVQKYYATTTHKVPPSFGPIV